jgi:hypothetical protein
VINTGDSVIAVILNKSLQALDMRSKIRLDFGFIGTEQYSVLLPTAVISVYFDDVNRLFICIDTAIKL